MYCKVKFTHVELFTHVERPTRAGNKPIQAETGRLCLVISCKHTCKLCRRKGTFIMTNHYVIIVHSIFIGREIIFIQTEQ